MSGEELMKFGHIQAYPTAVERFDGAEIVAWDDVPIEYQKKILNGTMTDEDWVAEWDKPPVAKPNNHVHVWRKEYPTCMIKGCGCVRE